MSRYSTRARLVAILHAVLAGTFASAAMAQIAPSTLPGYGPTGYTGAAPPSAATGTTLPSSTAATPQVPDERQKLFDQSIYYLKHLDRNGNGVIEPDEATGGKGHSHEEIFRGLMQKAGLPPTLPVATNIVRDRLAISHGIAPAGAGFATGMYGAYGSTAGVLQPTFGVNGYTGSTGAAGVVSSGTPTATSSTVTVSRDQQRLYEQCLEVLKHLDANRNGIIDPNEPTGGTGHSHKQMYEDVMQKAGLPAATPASINIIRDRLAVVFQIPNAAGTAPGQPTTGGTSVAGAPLVPGFGASAAAPLVPGFGPPTPTTPATIALTPAASPASNRPVSSSAAKSDADREMERKVAEWVEATFKQADANRSGRLEKDEWRSLRHDPSAADTNRDGVITREELTARFLQYAKERSRDRKDGEQSSAKPYRIIAPTLKLPKGLPDWFLQKDADADGQVSMAEFAADWNEATVAEYAKYDLNQDGVVTPQECLEVVKETEKDIGKKP